jgi:hypothetical protein
MTAVKLLFDDRWAPITSQIGFLETDCTRTVQTFYEWQTELQKERGVTLVMQPVSGPLENALKALLPLTSVERRRALFVPTASSWTAYFDNGHQGTDAFPPMSYLAQRLGCRGLKVMAVPDSKEGTTKPGRGRYGAITMELYGPQKTDWLNFIRAISLTNQGSKWEFVSTGTPFPFEDTARYQTRNVKQRFSFELLAEYLRALGVMAFEENFYMPTERPTALLVERIGPANKNLKEFTLAEVQSKF